MMAYRAAEHETTGTTPNLLMLGRETTMPLDLIYCMPTSVKPVPTNQWVWELKERIEDAHTFVRGHIKQAILRQKTYHDKKLSWRKFEKGDEVYIFFPQKKIGCSPKLTSFWRGPFTILRKMSDVLYEVNCGRSGKPQVIHCDRIKKKISQMLREEDVDLVINDRVIENVENEIDTHTDEFTDVSLRDNIRPRREVMVKTKTTPRLTKQVTLVMKETCPLCKEEYSDTDKLKNHVLTCAQDKSRLTCYQCNQMFKKTLYYARHMKKYHQHEEFKIVEAPQRKKITVQMSQIHFLMTVNPPQEVEKSFPIPEKSSNKQKIDGKVHSPDLNSKSETEPEEHSEDTKSESQVTSENRKNKREIDSTFQDKAVQVEGLKHRKYIKTVTRYVENNREIEETVLEEFLSYD
ncbi:unnamed protein product [Mytilus edulis]|uniref:C2H2-type domain-containing protein n=1 Tax=Mytilus edulis TaxID=6550 RepID=A0A8S3UQL1_MYTED|nr:unnamed protein product [Mytilus edulis]